MFFLSISLSRGFADFDRPKTPAHVPPPPTAGCSSRDVKCGTAGEETRVNTGETKTPKMQGPWAPIVDGVDYLLTQLQQAQAKMLKWVSTTPVLTVIKIT